MHASRDMDREKVYRIVQERGLASFANNTRWTSFFTATSELRILARLKHVAWGEVSEWSRWIVPSSRYLEVSSAGPVHFREIEWVDFACAESDLRRVALELAAREAKLETVRNDLVVRVFGYRLGMTGGALVG